MPKPKKQILKRAVRQFQSKPRIARLATIGPDGYLHIVPQFWILDFRSWISDFRRWTWDVSIQKGDADRHSAEWSGSASHPSPQIQESDSRLVATR